MRVYLSRALIFVCFLFLAKSGFALSIVHTPVETWYGKSALTIRAHVLTTKAIFGVNLHYRIKGQSLYVTTEMIPIERLFTNQEIKEIFYSAEIPRSYRNSEGLEYYIEVINVDWEKKFHPGDMAYIDPHEVKVAEDVETPHIQMVVPESKDNISDTQPLFVFNYNDEEDYPVDDTRLLFILDNRDITSIVKKNYYTATFKTDRKLAPGKHILKIYEESFNNKKLLSLVSFTIGKETRSNYSGEIVHKFLRNYREISPPVPTENTASSHSTPVDDETKIKVDASYSDFDLAADVNLSARENISEQPYNRHYVVINNKEKNLFLRMGDSSPMFSSLSLSGLNVRGIELTYNTDLFELKWSIGQAARQAEGSETYGLPGTFSRELSALRTSFNFGNTFFLGTNFLVISDNQNSIVSWGGTNPQENYLAALDTKWLLNEGKTIVESEAAFSVYYRNTSNEDQEVDGVPEIVKSFFPLKAGIQADWAALAKIKTPLLLFNNIQGHISQTGSEFNNLGTSSIRSDRREYYIKDKIFIFTKSLYIQGAYKYSHDKLPQLTTSLSTKPYQSSNANVALGGGIAFSFLPNITFSVSKDDKWNDSAEELQQRDSTMYNGNVNLRNIGFDLLGFKNSFSVNVSMIDAKDNLPANPSRNAIVFTNITRGGTWGLKCFDTVDLSVNGSLSEKKDAGSDNKTTTYKNVSVKLQNKLPDINGRIYFKIKYTKGDDDQDTLNNEKVQPEIGFLYEPVLKHIFSMKIAAVENREFTAEPNNYRDLSMRFDYKVRF